MKGHQLASQLRNLVWQQQFQASMATATRGYATQLAIRGADALRAGPGGRSSVSGVTATIFGCSGFVARYVAQALGCLGTQLVFPHRCDPLDVQHLRTMGDLGMVVPLGDFNIRSDDEIRKAISQSDLVINFIGADNETWNYSFEEVHVDIPARLARLAKEAGVERFLHFSALGASHSAPSRRLRTKAAGEDAVSSEFGDTATIFRPAPITGTEDRLFNRYARMIKALPAMPLIDGGEQRMQPVWVRDVSKAVVNALHTFDSLGKTYDLAGPDVFTVRQLVEHTYQTIREPSATVSIPSSVARALSAPRDWFGKRTPFQASPPFTTDAVDEVAADLLLPAGGNALTFADLDVKPHRVTEGIPIEYLRHYRSGGYDFGTTGPDAVPGAGRGFRSPQANNA
jgi:NADH dehydrogenase (ubiquinone) 1 alpha subcomplex subunit 9